VELVPTYCFVGEQLVEQPLEWLEELEQPLELILVQPYFVETEQSWEMVEGMIWEQLVELILEPYFAVALLMGDVEHQSL